MYGKAYINFEKNHRNGYVQIGKLIVLNSRCNRQIYSPFRILLMKSLTETKVNSFDACSSKYFGWRNIDAVIINSLHSRLN